jgi:internalin A
MMKQLPFYAYKGEEPYLFISYSHKDSAAVFSIIEKFNDKGYPIWYDEGIEPGNEWPKEIAKALAACKLFIVFISPRSVASDNVRNEINFALAKKLPVLAIYLEETGLTDGLLLQLGSKQAIMKYRMSDNSFYYKCHDAFRKIGLTAVPLQPQPDSKSDSQSGFQPIFQPEPLPEKNPNPILAWIIGNKVVSGIAAGVLVLAIAFIAWWMSSANDISPVMASSVPESSVVESSAQESSVPESSVVESSVSESSEEESPAQPQTITIGGETVDVNATELDLTSKYVNDIRELRYLTNLVTLNLKYTGVTDVSVLKELTNLRYVDVTFTPLYQSQVDELREALPNCTIEFNDGIGDKTTSSEQPLTITIGGKTVDVNVTQLDLAGKSIKDISKLSGLTNLKGLWLEDNNITDIRALSGLTNLTKLYLTGNPISDISVLGGLTNLSGLWMDDNSINDIGALSGLANLSILVLDGNDVSDISALSGLINITWLGLGNNNISDISALRELTKLDTLYLEHNNISDISALRELTKLDTLHLEHNNISDIRALSGLTALVSLYLNGNNISDISILAGLTNLTDLDLTDNNISDINALKERTNLKQLTLTGNPLTQSQIDELQEALPNCTITF